MGQQGGKGRPRLALLLACGGKGPFHLPLALLHLLPGDTLSVLGGGGVLPGAADGAGLPLPQLQGQQGRLLPQQLPLPRKVALLPAAVFLRQLQGVFPQGQQGLSLLQKGPAAAGILPQGAVVHQQAGLLFPAAQRLFLLRQLLQTFLQPFPLLQKGKGLFQLLQLPLQLQKLLLPPGLFQQLPP